MDRGNEVPLRVGGLFAFAGLLGVAAVISFQPSPDPDINQVLLRSELAMAQEQRASLQRSLQVNETEAAAALAAKVESIAIIRQQKMAVKIAVIPGDEGCPLLPGENQTEADKYSDPWAGSKWRWGFVIVIILGLVLLYAQIQEVREESDPLAAPSRGFMHAVITSIKSVDTFKQLCAYDPFNDGSQAPAGNAYRLLAVVGPDMFGISSHNHDGLNPFEKDRTDGGYKCTLPNFLGYLVILFMTLCILVMQLYIPYTLLTGVIGNSKFIGFKVTQYYFDFPARLGLELVPLTLMSMKFFVKVEKVVRDEFNQCMWLFKAALANQIQFQVLGRPWALFWITTSFVANTYIAVCMTFYVVLAICTYEGGDIMSFFLKVLGSLGLISFDDDIMAALPQWSGWYAQHTNQAGHPLGGHPMGCPADFFAGPESVRAGGDMYNWGYNKMAYTQTVTVNEDDGQTDASGLDAWLNGDWFSKSTMVVTEDTTQEGKKLLKGMRLTSVHGTGVSSSDDLKTCRHTVKTTYTIHPDGHKSHDDYAKDYDITWDRQNPLVVAAVGEKTLRDHPEITPGARLTHLHGNEIENHDHLKTIAKMYEGQTEGVESLDHELKFLTKSRGDSAGNVACVFTLDSKTAIELAKGSPEQQAKTQAKLAELKPQKVSCTKYVKIGLQFCEGCEELGFRLSGTMISSIMKEEGSAAFNAVDMSEVKNGRPHLGLEPYKGEGQPFGEDRMKYLYKGRTFSPEMMATLDGFNSGKPPQTGLQTGMCIVKINDTTVNGFGEIARELRYIKGDNLNYSDMRYDEEKTEEGWANEWRGDEKILKRVMRDVSGKGKSELSSKEFTIVVTRAGDEDSNFDDFVHGFIYMLIRVLLLFSLLFILISYWQKDCKHVGV